VKQETEEDRGPVRVEAHMKTLSLLLLGLIGATACSSTRTSAPAERSSENQAFCLIPLQFAAADEVAHELGQLRPGARAVADARTNSVLLSATSEAELDKLRECVAQLDVQVKGAK